MDGELGHPYFVTTVFIGMLPSFNGTIFEALSALSTYPDVTQPIFRSSYYGFLVST